MAKATTSRKKTAETDAVAESKTAPKKPAKKSETSEKKASPRKKKTESVSTPAPVSTSPDNTPELMAVPTPALPADELAKINALNAKLAELATMVRQAFDTHNFALARQILIEQVLQLAPNHPVGLNDLAFAEKSLGNLDAAHQIASFALKHAAPEQLAEIYDSLASISYLKNCFEESLFYGRAAINAKKSATATQIYPLPKRKKKGLHSDKAKNIISFSLFGASPRYTETAVVNASLAQHIYPEWTCRFYVDDSVPAHVITRLEQHGSQIVKVENTTLSGLFWRFKVMADPSVHCFIIRDADSLLSYKEAYAVKAWLDSKKHFHIMRDAYEHSELILAGMWGGYTGVFDDIETMMTAFLSQLKVTNRTIDQQFLRQMIYPTVAQDVLVHDSRQLEIGSEPFPAYPLSDVEKIPYFHIGMVDAHAQTTTVYLEQPAQKVAWFLVNENEQMICFYEATPALKDGKLVVQLNLPYFYSQNITQGLWHIKYQILAQ